MVPRPDSAGNRQPSLKVGLLLPTREAMLGGRPDARLLLELGEAAEHAGFDSLWVGDSLLARSRLEPLALLCALAARTRSATLGTAVLLAPLRHPLLLAHQLATLDQIAGGRLILALGSGFPYPATEAEFAAAGVPFKQRVGRLLEMVELWRLLWSDDAADEQRKVSFDGRYWQPVDIDLQPKPCQPGGPPLWLAGEGPNALRHAGSAFDGWLPYSPTPVLFEERCDEVKRAAEAAGRPAPTAALYATVALADDRGSADAQLDGYASAYYGFPLEVMRQLQAFYGGEPEGCVEWLGNYIDAGARHLIIRLGTLDQHERALERFAELLPRLRDRASAQPPMAAKAP
jgi:alkanesulfonate monooxygenase SsuD/methylene tetrahydromethanopterin reductase-like flavin-dependent oxidoreductase (luciferase family)